MLIHIQLFGKVTKGLLVTTREKNTMVCMKESEICRRIMVKHKLNQQFVKATSQLANMTRAELNNSPQNMSTFVED